MEAGPLIGALLARLYPGRSHATAQALEASLGARRPGEDSMRLAFSTSAVAAGRSVTAEHPSGLKGALVCPGKQARVIECRPHSSRLSS
jgi:hypothetical protein